MLHRITSWMKNTNFASLIKFNSNCPFSKATWQKFWQDHPRFGGGILIFSIVAAISVVAFYWNFFPSDPGSTQSQIFEVPYGSSLRQVGKELQARGLIRSSFIFEVYVRLNPKKRMVKAGRCQLGPGMNLFQIVKELRRGIPGQIRITVPEGLTAKEIADLYSRKGLANRDRFLALLKDSQFIGGIMGEGWKAHPEGHLFPDTYDFSLNVTEEEILVKMLKRFNEVFDAEVGEATPLQKREILIIASIVEKEAKKEDERQIIAGIFYNRLRRGYPLQSCATVQYALGKHKKRLYYKDLQVNSPYNTYLYSGLPPGPIANPGLASIRAAVSPAKVDYLYFVAKPDGSHIFSSTYKQHLLAQRKVERGN
ncbi:MAG: endolytic transglycosylase MltG [Bacteroidota bacterium]